jgi:CRISPR-associated protein Cas5h
MNPISVISFRYSSKYGHFRKPYSNVSSLSYPFPPRTAIAGLLGSILGIPKEKVATYFNADNLKVAVIIEGEIRTVTHLTNLRQDCSGRVHYSIKHPEKDWNPAEETIHDWNKVARVPRELLRKPSYIIYTSINHDMQELASRIKNERYFYTPSMGLSEFFARLEFISEGLAMPLNPGEYDISTVIPKDDCSLSLSRLNIEKEHQLQEVKAPYTVTFDRRFTLRSYLFNMAPVSLPVRMKVSPYCFDDEIITFL